MRRGGSIRATGTFRPQLWQSFLAEGADYSERAKRADAIGDRRLVVQLEDMVRVESGHSEETERILRDWPL